MKYCALTETGKRQHNEDAVFVPSNGEVALAMVADGMGGHNAGDVASAMAVEAVVFQVKNGGKDPGELLKQALNAANSAIYAAAQENRAMQGMGTTAVAVLPFADNFAAANVGDSRVYLYREGELTQISRDHSYVQELVDAGYITKAQAAVHPRRNIITRALGTAPSETADIFRHTWKQGDMLLLCSDGLTSGLADMEIVRILGEEKQLDAACERLVKEALDGGSTDNISVVLILNEV